MLSANTDTLTKNLRHIFTFTLQQPKVAHHNVLVRTGNGLQAEVIFVACLYSILSF
jgi:hypothetical protein